MNENDNLNVVVTTLLNFEISLKCMVVMISCVFSVYCIFSFLRIIYLKIYQHINEMIKNEIDSIHIISIDGNIGSGKSTLINILKKHFNDDADIFFVDEPVEEWINVSDHNNTNILDQFYKEKKRWSYTFQNFAFITRICQLSKTLKKIKQGQQNKKPRNKIILTERSTETDKNVFAKMLYDSCDMSELEYSIYIYWYNKIIDDYPKINNIIYLSTTPEVSFERIMIRNRSEELKIPRKYIENVHAYHENWLNNSDLNICKLNCSKDFQSDDTFRKILIDEMVTYINKLKNNY
jgi:deoxyadenosine/deoxycytidine kinase